MAVLDRTPRAYFSQHCQKSLASKIETFSAQISKKKNEVEKFGTMQHNHQEYANIGEKILRAMRKDAGLSQIEMAEHLGVSMQCISSWETGKSCPDMLQAWEWYHACGRNHMPYVMNWQHPDRYKGNHTDLDDALMEAIFALDDADKERLLYAISGDHGSFFPGVLQLILAHLHLPLKGRIGSAVLVTTNYNMAERRGTLLHTDKPMPNMDLLDRSIHAGMAACFEDKEGYSME